MHKKILFCLLSTVLSLFIKTQTHATATIPEATNKFYAQNNIIFTLPYASDDPCATQTVADYGDLNNRIITAMSFLTNKGYSINAAAAIVGNLIAESSLVPNKIEGKDFTFDVGGEKHAFCAICTQVEKNTVILFNMHKI